MATFTELLGNSLLSDGATKIITAEALAGKGAVAIYFSAHWCPPCRGFTPKLAEWYKKDLRDKGLEIVFVSSDEDEASFKEYFGEQPWLALPFEEREAKDKLSKKYKVQGIPALVILDSDGNIIAKDGRSAVSEDPTGVEFPWKPVPVKQLLEKAPLISNSGGLTLEEAMKEKQFLALYFSAHWCPPCRGFTPKLAEWYKKDLKGKGLEVIFVSSDRDEAAFKEYFAEQPWLALDFSDQALKNKLSKAFGVQGIPTLVILDSNLNTITTEGTGVVPSDPTGLEMPWFPKPVKNLKQGPGEIQEVPTVIVFCETNNTSEQKSIEEVLAPIAKKFLDKKKETGDDLELSFVIATEGAGLASRVRGMLGLPALPLPLHEHPLEKKEGGNWGCDGCQQSGAGKKRYRCTQGCDFDFCGECYEKANSGEEPVKMNARMAIVDMPSEGAYYLAVDGVSITSASVEDFVANFQAGKLERKQLPN